MSLQSFFYDKQIRRYLIQFIAMLSNFQVEFGKDRNGTVALQRVPVIYGDSSRQAAQIIRQNSENIMNSVPAMAVYISDLKYDRERVQSPTYIGKMSLRERYYDPSSGQYLTTQGDTLSVERLMPVPYKLTLKVDIWTSNTEQKLQLLEQLSILFNPALEIQSTDNYIDWTSLTYVLLTDTSWSSRTIPVGTENPIDITTMTFELPIFISAPALVKKMGVVQKIIASIYDADGNIDEAIFSENNLMSRQYITPLQYGVILLDNKLSLVKYNEPVVDPLGNQVIKEITENVAANNTVIVDDTLGITEGMIVSGLAFKGNGSISGNIRSNVITGVSTHFTSNLVNGTSLFYNGQKIGTVRTVINDQSLTLYSNTAANISGVGYDYLTAVNYGNCVVLATNGDTLTASNLVTANIGDRIVFSEVTHKNGTNDPWRNLINVYGNLVNGTSQVRLEQFDGHELVGTVAYDPTDDTALLWTPDIDTLPTNTLPPINAIIDPQSSRPNRDLQSLVNGTRYLLIRDYITPDGEQPTYNWMGIDNTPLRAYANDIIQYNGQHWSVVFDASQTIAVNYVTNLTTGIQYKWNGTAWSKSYEGYYEAGKWQLVL